MLINRILRKYLFEIMWGSRLSLGTRFCEQVYRRQLYGNSEEFLGGLGGKVTSQKVLGGVKYR